MLLTRTFLYGNLSPVEAIPLQVRWCNSGVEYFLGKEEVGSSNLLTSLVFYIRQTEFKSGGFFSNIESGEL